MKHWKIKSLLGAFLLGGFLYWQNNGLMVSRLTYGANVPEAFDGFKILQVADLQNKKFGRNHEKLLKKIDQSAPDMIVMTGDLLDRNRTDVAEAMVFVKKARDIAPIYFVSGNHEHQSGAWDELQEQLTEAGVKVLDNGKSVIARGEDTITLLGLADKKANPYFVEVLETLTQGIDGASLTILLSHRPEQIQVYAENQIDLVFAGHAHGGQIRLPFLGGLFAPHQGFFPKYTSGMIHMEQTAMVVSRGLGNSTFPIRLFNRPELVEVVLESQAGWDRSLENALR